jgi:hypothetical protein
MPLFPDSPLRLRIRGTVGARPVDEIASLVVNGDVLLLVPAEATDGRGVRRIPLADIDGVSHIADDGGTITIHLTGAASLVGSGDARVAALAARILAEGRAMPELARATRSLGARHGGREQGWFFRPLLEARRAAVLGGPDAVAAFDPRTLHRAVEHVLARIAAERHPAPGPGRRALEARLADAVEPLFAALAGLAPAAMHALGADDAAALRGWREWLDAVRTVFDRADAAWMAVGAILHAPSPASLPLLPPTDRLRRWTT